MPGLEPNSNSDAKGAPCRTCTDFKSWAKKQNVIFGSNADGPNAGRSNEVSKCLRFYNKSEEFTIGSAQSACLHSCITSFCSEFRQTKLVNCEIVLRNVNFRRSYQMIWDFFF